MREPDLGEADLASFAGKLEDMELDCLRIGARERLNAKMHFDKLSSMKLSEAGVEQHKRAAVVAVKKYEGYLVRRIQNCFVRAAACELRSAFVFLDQDAITRIRIRDVREDISSLSVELDRFENTVRDRLPELKGFTRLEIIYRKHQLELSDQTQATVSKGRQLIEEMLGGLSFAEQNIIEGSGNDLAVCIDIDEHGKLSGITTVPTATEK